MDNTSFSFCADAFPPSCGLGQWTKDSRAHNKPGRTKTHVCIHRHLFNISASMAAVMKQELTPTFCCLGP